MNNYILQVLSMQILVQKIIVYLSENFIFLTPTLGPISSKLIFFSDLVYFPHSFGDFQLYHIFRHHRVDPYDTYRVWVDVKLSTSKTSESSDLKASASTFASSFSIYNDGRCTMITVSSFLLLVYCQFHFNGILHFQFSAYFTPLFHTTH